MTTSIEDLTVSDLSRLLAEASDKETGEFNTMFDELESANKLVAELQKDIVNYKVVAKKFYELEAQSETVLKNGEAHLNTAKQAYRERDQMADKLSTVEELLKAYKVLGTPKKIREKIKTYQTKIADGITSLNASKDKVKDGLRSLTKLATTVEELRLNDAQNSMSSLWSEDGDNLMMFPARLTMKIGDVQEKQLTLLYMTASGCGKLIAIDEDGNPVECTLPEEGLNPKPRTLEVAGTLLRKWRRNGWRLEVSDLDLSNM